MRTTIGVAEIDALIEGGVPRGASVLVCGEAGTGKSVLSLEFILAGIREGEPGVYVTADEPGRVLETAASLGWDLRGAIEDGYARIVQVLPPGSSTAAPAAPTMAAAGGPGGPGGPGAGMPMAGQANGAASAPAPVAGGPASATVAAIIDAVQEIQAERVAIDPPLGPGAAGEAAAAFIADLLRGVLEETHCTTMITGQRVHGANGYTRLGIEEQLVDGIVDLRMVERDGRRQRVVSVRAMHGTQIDLDDHAFSITAGRGIAVEG
jgi:circadian clock protein KaiC